jgi:hypothetical protein
MTRTKTTSETQWAALARRNGASELLDMLTYARPAGSDTEMLFIRKFIDDLPNCYADGYGNRIVAVGTAPTVLWSSHTDTVHKTEGRQALSRTENHFIVRKEPGDCLGADCTTGVWLMRQMIGANIPGLYVFHREEEIGGLGSQWIADKTPYLLSGIRYAIAFDRKGESSVITHQSGGRCASDAFANALCDVLGETWKPDDTGTFTDTANYSGIVPECTNISVGYWSQHTNNESQNLTFALDLRDRLLAADLSNLPCVRDPDDYSYGFDYGPTHNFDRDDITDAIWSNPEGVADFLIDNGFSIEDLEPYLRNRRR